MAVSRCYPAVVFEMIMVDVAQLVELRIVTPAVEGSNPFVHPTFLSELIPRLLNRLMAVWPSGILHSVVREWRNW